MNSRMRQMYSGNDEKWNVIADTINAILNKMISRYSFQQVHHSVFQLCQRQCSSDLFDYLENTLTERVKGICEFLLTIPEEFLLQELRKEWDSFSLAVRHISEALLYLNKNYTSHRQTIPQMGENLFCTIVLRNDEILATFINCVQASLTSNPDSRIALKALCPKLRDLYKESLYEPCVEDPLIRVVANQYSQQIESKHLDTNANEYLAWSLDSIEKAKVDISDLVGNDTGERVEQNLGCVLIKRNAERLLYGPSGGATMVKNFDSESLQRLSTALEKVNELPALVEMITSTLKKIGLDQLRVVDHNSSQQGVERVLALRKNAMELVDKLSGVPKGDRSPVIRALTDIVNDDVCFAEKLAHYYDARVKPQPEEDELGKIATDIFGLFRLLKAKDSFEYVFKMLLASRLINAKPEDSVTHEAFLIEQLKKECGDSVVNHLEIMIKDAKMRTEVNRGFLRSLSTENELPLSFNVTVVTAGAWPQYTMLPLDLPLSMRCCAALFEHYYIPRHNGRRLSFHTNLGTVSFTLNHGKKYELVTPTAFVNTILCFENDEKRTLEELCIATKLQESDAIVQLESLSQMKLITSFNIDGVVKYGFNKNFSNGKSKLRVRTAYGNKNREENLEPRIQCESLEASRSMSIQAAMVRIMKSKKTLEHSELCALVKESLQKTGFVPGIADIKRDLEILMGKGIILRGTRADSYIYES